MPRTALVGNDVVDLDDPGARGAHLRERLVQRVLTEPERARLASSEAPHALFWALFAAKEAAYKVVAKLRPGAAFAHRAFEVDAALGHVRYDGLCFPLRVRVTPEHVSALAWTSIAPALASVVEAKGADLGIVARAALTTALAERLGCAPAELTIVREPRPGSWDGFAPPRVLRSRKPLAADVSLSHDGRFVSYAVVFRA
jgi:phosphopantetheinyl transferase (holo-ACP synthase)